MADTRWMATAQHEFSILLAIAEDKDYKIFKPQYKLFCYDINICCNLHTFQKALGKYCVFLGQEQCFFGKKCSITWYIYNAYRPELNLRFGNYTQKRRICRENSKNATHKDL